MSTDRPTFEPADVPPDVKVAVIAARFNARIVDELLDGCRRRLEELGVGAARISTYRVPGAFELPVAAKMVARSGRYSAIICLGCVIRGETPHFDYVAGEAANGVQRVALDEALPVIFGVLTTDTEHQAEERAGGRHGHAGKSAAEAALEMILLSRALRKG